MNLASILAGVALVAPLAAGSVPLELVATIEMPDVKGRIDHFAVDVKGRRLFIAALGNDTVEVVDIGVNRHVKSLAGFKAPQGLIYLPETHRVYVANGEGGRVDVLDASSFELVKRIGELDDADNVRYDAANGTVLVGYGNGALRLLNAQTSDAAGDIRPAGHPESFQLESAGKRAFVNIPTAQHVAVVDRAARKVVATWPLSRAGKNFPMALDDQDARLFVGARAPALLLVYDTASGKVVARLPIGGDTDDLFFDAARKRIYVICGEGQVDVFRQEAADRYTREASIQTAARARTGLFVPEMAKLFVAAPAAAGKPARLLVYQAK